MPGCGDALKSDFLILIQARVGSSRLPGKVMMPLKGRAVLERMWERVTGIRTTARFGIITSTESSDDVVETLCRNIGAPCYRGSRDDLLDRHYKAWREWGGEAIVKIPSDCPLIDPAVIDRVLQSYRPTLDYLSNLHPQSYPDGNDVEVFSYGALETAWREATLPHEREHTTPFFWDNPKRFVLANVTADGPDLSKTHRYTLDYSEDYELIKIIFESLYPVNRLFGVEDIIRLLDNNPDLKRLNAKHHGYHWDQRPAATKETVR